MNHWITRAASYENDVIDVSPVHLSILEHCIHNREASIEYRFTDLLKFFTCYCQLKVLVLVETLKTYHCLCCFRKLDLGILTGIRKSHDGSTIVRQVNTHLLLELLDAVKEEVPVEVNSAKMRVSFSRDDGAIRLVYLEHRAIECPST